MQIFRNSVERAKSIFFKSFHYVINECSIFKKAKIAKNRKRFRKNQAQLFISILIFYTTMVNFDISFRLCDIVL